MKYVPKPEAELINYKFENPIRNFIILTSCLGLLVVALTLALAILIQPILLSLSPSWEHSLFSWIVPDEVQVFKEGQEVLQELIGDEAKHYSVFLLCDEEEINAAAYPGNAIIFSSELLRILKNKNSLAFILGHEYGHFKNRDLAKSMGWGLSSLIVKAVFALDSDTGSFFSQDLLLLHHGRSQERAADEVAIPLVRKMFNGLAGAADFFITINYEQELGERFLSTHPLIEERIAFIQSHSDGSGEIVVENYDKMVRQYCGS